MTDNSGNELVPTYKKRALGLVKKGRAEFINDYHIRMKPSDACPTVLMEDNMGNIQNIQNSRNPVRIDFNARKWKFDKNHKEVGTRTFVTDFMGNLVESYSIGNWAWDWTMIKSPKLALAKNTEHVFAFWLNGGENERAQEVCNLTISFDEDYDSHYTYKLNRNFIEYKMHYKGWYLYEIPFTTLDNEITELYFECMYAHTTIIPAREIEYYGNLQASEPLKDVPQRANIVFPEGYPRDAHWSWKVFGQNTEHKGGSITSSIRDEIFNRIDLDSMIGELIDNASDEINDELSDVLRERLEEMV